MMKKAILLIVMLSAVLGGCETSEESIRQKEAVTASRTMSSTASTDCETTTSDDVSVEMTTTSAETMIAQTVLTTTAVTTENIALQSQTKITETTTVTSTQTTAQSLTATAPTTTEVTPIVTTTATAKTTSTAAITVQTTAKTEFDINSRIKFAIDYAEGVGLEIDEAAKDCWDNPIMANEKCIYLERDIKSRLDLYSQNPDISAVWIWAEEVSYGNYELYIGYA